MLEHQQDRIGQDMGVVEMKHPEESEALERYANVLEASGMEERDVARAVIYLDHYGMHAMDGIDKCISFDEPSCGNWNCMNPTHQRLIMIGVKNN